MKHPVKGREMKDATCEYISLVPRGANQIPFRKIKSDKSQENAMSLDITSLRRRLQKRETAPVAVGMVVRKNEDFDAVKTVLVEQGFAVDRVVEKAGDDLVVFLQPGAEEASLEGAGLMAVDGGDVMMAVKGFNPWTDKLETFSDRVTAQGFYMGVDSAVDVLEGVLFDVISDSDAQKDMSADIGDACDQFKAYVLGMVKAVPAAAFKLETALKASLPKHSGKKPTNGDSGKAMSENGSQDPNVHQHGTGGESVTAVNQDVMPPDDKVTKKQVRVLDAAALDNALKSADPVEAVKALMLEAPVVQDEDGPGEGAVTAVNSDKPADYASAVDKQATPPKDENGKFMKVDDKEDGKDGKSKKGELPTDSVDPKNAEGSNQLADALKGLTELTSLVKSLKGDIDTIRNEQVAQQEQITSVMKTGETLSKTLSTTVMNDAPANERPTRTAAPTRKSASGGVLDTAFGGKGVFGGR